MAEGLKKWLKISKDIPLREEVVLNLKVAASILDNSFNKVIENYGITAHQYNVLRILNGVYPEGHARCEIAVRMVERASDVTRIIDRLEKQNMVERGRTKEDRRISITRITEKGVELVNLLNPVIEKSHLQATKNLTDQECSVLSGLLEKLYSDKN